MYKAFVKHFFVNSPSFYSFFSFLPHFFLHIRIKLLLTFQIYVPKLIFLFALERERERNLHEILNEIFLID